MACMHPLTLWSNVTKSSYVAAELPALLMQPVRVFFGRALDSQVIRFTMQGVPGHFAVSWKVEFKALRAKAFQKLQLAGGGKEKQKGAERQKVP